MSTIQNLCLLLIAAQLLGLLARRVGLPELLGQIAAGALLGPAALGWVQPDPALNGVGDLALLFVVASSGLELRLESLLSVYRGAGLLKQMPGFLLPAAAGLLLAKTFAFDWPSAIVIALTLAVTALPVALRVLSSAGLLGTPLARIAIAGALMDDVLVLLALGLMPAVAGAAQSAVSGPLGLAVLKLAGLLVLVAAGAWVCRVWTRLDGDVHAPLAAHPMAALLLILILAAASEALGLHFAIGAFLGALTVSKYGEGEDALHSLHPPAAFLNDLLFAPLFLATQGVRMIAIGPAEASFTLALTAVAVASKLIGGYLSARLFGLPRRDSQGVAIILNTRGVMAMVAASIAFRSGLIDNRLYSTLLASCVAATFCTLLLLRRWQTQHNPPLTEST